LNMGKNMKKKAILVLRDGSVYEGIAFGAEVDALGEVVFNTSMTGYQEVLTDPSYRGQMVTMTYPLIGNYGVNPQDVESERIQVAAFLVREYQEYPSNYRSTGSLAQYLKENGVLGVEGLDTRALTRHIRTTGALRAFISTQDLDPASLVQRANAVPSMSGRDLASVVTSPTPFRWAQGKRLPISRDTPLDTGIWRHPGEKAGVVAFDYGIKYTILRCLEEVGCEVVVVPASTPAETVKRMSPSGIFLSNGPGDPEPVAYAVETIGKLIGYRPIFGICLGIQLLGIALGGKTYKLKFGHRGANQPVKRLETGRVEITSQNHGFAVDIDSLDAHAVEITHINLNDNTLEGFRHKRLPLFAVQYHPEASPGPHDARYLFDMFSKLMNDYR